MPLRVYLEYLELNQMVAARTTTPKISRDVDHGHLRSMRGRADRPGLISLHSYPSTSNHILYTLSRVYSYYSCHNNNNNNNNKHQQRQQQQTSILVSWKLLLSPLWIRSPGLTCQQNYNPGKLSLEVENPIRCLDIAVLKHDPSLLASRSTTYNKTALSVNIRLFCWRIRISITQHTRQCPGPWKKWIQAQFKPTVLNYYK